jgi:hypothetical protein
VIVLVSKHRHHLDHDSYFVGLQSNGVGRDNMTSIQLNNHVSNGISHTLPASPQYLLGVCEFQPWVESSFR